MRDGVGDEAKRYVSQRRAGKTAEQAAATVARQIAKASGKWVWEDLARRYPDDYLSNPRPTRRGMRPPSLKGAAAARRYLTDAAAIELLGRRLLVELRRSDFEAVRDRLLADGRKTASRQFVAFASAAMSYAKRHFAGDSGLEDAFRWWVDVQPRQETLPVPKSRFPTIGELARVLRLADVTRVMPGRDIQRGTSQTVVSSLWWVALTAQRASAALAVRKEHILPWPDGPEGWKVVGFPAEMMKGKRIFYLPIPPRVVMLLERMALVADPASPFVFPALRTRKGDGDRPLYRSTPRLLIQRLRGRPADLSMTGRPFEPGPDLLEGIPHFARTTYAGPSRQRAETCLFAATRHPQSWITPMVTMKARNSRGLRPLPRSPGWHTTTRRSCP